MSERSPLDSFKSVLSGAARAISRDMEVDVGFTPERPEGIGGHARRIGHEPRDHPAVAGDRDLFAAFHLGEQ